MLSIKVPPLGESIVEATVSRWLKKEGDAVASGDTVVELDTDKITVEVPALKAGVLSKQAVKEGDVVHVDDVLGQIDESSVGASAGAPARVAAGVSAPPASPRPISEPAKDKSGGLGGAAGAGFADTPAAPR
ncbi:MAG: biotin/lipoyl-containing protein, partial [Gemmatimonadaceae bacterium]